MESRCGIENGVKEGGYGIFECAGGGVVYGVMIGDVIVTVSSLAGPLSFHPPGTYLLR